jgi:hypothetical protein
MAVMAGLTLDQFWESTPFELSLVLAGYSMRVRNWYEVGAFVAAHVINVWTKRKVRPRQLLPPRPGVVDVRSFGSKEELDKFMAQRRKEREQS